LRNCLVLFFCEKKQVILNQSPYRTVPEKQEKYNPVLKDLNVVVAEEDVPLARRRRSSSETLDWKEESHVGLYDCSRV
jgi:hypothetical protein